MHQYLIAYDVCKVSVRNAVARRLEKAGRRLQKSVFIVKLSENAAKTLEHDLQRLMEADDSLLIVPLCESCLKEAVWTGPLLPVLLFP